MLTIIDDTTSTTAATEATVDDATIDRFAWTVERTGLRDHEDMVGRIVGRARPAGVSTVLVDVLADPGEPENARVRAFGKVALQLGARHLAA